MSEDESKEIQRWTAKRRAALVVSIIKGETSAVEAGTQAQSEGVRDRGLAGEIHAAAENSLRSRPRDEEALKDEQIKRLKQKVGELVLDIDILQTANRLRPTDPTFDK